MDSAVTSNEKQKQSSWVMKLFLIIALLAFSVFAYQKWTANSYQDIDPSELLLQQQLILNQEDSINTNWLRTLNPLVKNVVGKIAWSNLLQQGMLEFSALPAISKNQKYQLWIYDLVGKDTKPILSTEFNEVNKGKTLVAISTEILIYSPLKFELILKTDGEETSQPLFLAQP